MSDEFRSWYQGKYPTDRRDTTYWWHPLNPIEVAYRHQRERAVIWAVRQLPRPPGDLDILDVGCGDGRPLRFLLELGADLERTQGIDLIEERIQDAWRVNPALRLTVGDAGAGLPYDDASFDLVCQFVAFSSMPEAAIRREAAADMTRVCRVGGHLLWYDTVVRRPGAVPDGITLDGVGELFPDFEVVAHRLVHPRWLNRLARQPLLAAIADATPFWPRTNLIGIARRVR